MRLLRIAGFVLATLPITARVSLAQFPDPGQQVYNVEAFGVKADRPGDSTQGIQAVIDKACSTPIPEGHPAVVMPSGIYHLTRPLLINCGAIEISGLGSRANTVLRPSYIGPSIIVEPKMTGVDPAPPLVGSHGHSFNTDGGNSVSVDLRDDPYVELDGLRTFTVETYFLQTKTADESARGLAALVSSAGSISDDGGSVPGASRTTAFILGISDTQNPYALITISHQQYTLTAPRQVSLNSVHHIALTYDGAAARLFLDGELVASRTATGTISQSAFENVCIGPMAGHWPGGTPRDASIAGFIDNVRLSNVARYISAFSPPVSVLPDSHTLILVPFDDDPPGVTRAVDLGNRIVWLPVRRSAEPNGKRESFIGRVSLHDFTMNGNGVFGWLATVGEYDHLRCEYCDYGLYFAGNSYESHFDNIYVLASNKPRVGRFGIFAQTNNGGEYANLTLNYSAFPLVIGGGSGAYYNVFISPGKGASIYGMVLEESQASINRIYFDAESPSSTWIADIISSNAWAPIVIMGGEIDAAGHATETANGIAPVIQDGGAPFIFIGTSFGFTGGYPCLAYVNRAPKRPIIWIGTTADSNVPLSNSARDSSSLDGPN